MSRLYTGQTDDAVDAPARQAQNAVTRTMDLAPAALLYGTVDVG